MPARGPNVSAPAPGGRAAPATVVLLAALARDVQLRLGEHLAESGDHGLRRSFAPLLQLIADGELASGRIATELGVSPQAASRATVTLEALGYVARRPNPDDRRSRLVGLTDRGRRLLEGAARTLAECEASYAGLVGEDAVSHLRVDLEDLREGFELQAEPGTGLHRTGTRSIGVVILLSLDAKAQVLRTVTGCGHEALRSSLDELLVTIGSGSARVSDLARNQQVSRQAVSMAVQELESLGYVRRRPDETDGRGIVLSLTERGAALAAAIAAAERRLEDRYRDILGVPRHERLREVLGDLVAALGVPAGSPGPLPGGRTGWTATDARAPLEDLARHLRDELGERNAARLALLLAGGTTRDGAGRRR